MGQWEAHLPARLGSDARALQPLGVGTSPRLGRLMEPQVRLRAGQRSLAPLSWPGGLRDSHVDPTPRAPLIPQEKHDPGVADWSPSPSCPSSCDFMIFTHLNNSRVKFYPWTHNCLQSQCDREPPH